MDDDRRMFLGVELRAPATDGTDQGEEFGAVATPEELETPSLAPVVERREN
jgi:hypothetical protein